METWSLLLQQWNLLLCSLLRPMWGLQDSWKDWGIWHSLWIADLLPSLHWWNALEKEDQEEVQHWGIWPGGCRHLLPVYTMCHLPEFQRDQREGGTLKTKLRHHLPSNPITTSTFRHNLSSKPDLKPRQSDSEIHNARSNVKLNNYWCR